MSLTSAARAGRLFCNCIGPLANRAFRCRRGKCRARLAQSLRSLRVDFGRESEVLIDFIKPRRLKRTVRRVTLPVFVLKGVCHVALLLGLSVSEAKPVEQLTRAEVAQIVRTCRAESLVPMVTETETVACEDFAAYAELIRAGKTAQARKLIQRSQK